jgi:hypothetical protein
LFNEVVIIRKLLRYLFNSHNLLLLKLFINQDFVPVF